MLKRLCLVDVKLPNHLGNLTQFPCHLHWDRVSYAARIPWVNFFLAHFHFLICVLLLYAVLSSSASTTAMRSYSSSSLSSPWNLSRRSMRQRESLWVFPLASFEKKKAWINIYSSLKAHFFHLIDSGRQWSTLTTKSSVTWLKRSTKASSPFWCVKCH